MDRHPLSTAAKVLGGLVSEGMLLAVGPGGSDIWLLSADAGAEPGMWVTEIALDSAWGNRPLYQFRPAGFAPHNQ